MMATDLLFLALALTSVLTLLTAAVLAVSGKPARAAAIVKRWAICAGCYMAVVVLTSIFLPRHIATPGEAQCSDDWCLTVEGVDRVSEGYRAALRIESRAGRVTQREYGVSVYLTDIDGRRYAAKTSPADVPFDVPIGPHEALETARVFELPAGVQPSGVVIRHDSGFPIGWFIIGYPTWFRKPTLVRVVEPPAR